MRRTAILLVLVALGAGLMLMTTGCETLKVKGSYAYAAPEQKKGPPPWAPAHGRRAKHRYSYYPDAKVYFEASRGMYFYYSGGQWRVSASLPSGISVSLGSSVSLEMDTDKPYKFHSDVIKNYPPGRMKKQAGPKGGKGKSKSKGKGKKSYY